MAKRTPDYTKQARRKQPPGRRPPAGRSASARRGEDQILPPNRATTVLVFAVLGAAALAFLAALGMTLPRVLDGGTAGKAAVLASVGMAGGVLANVLVAITAAYAFDPARFAFPRINKRMLAYGIAISGALAIVLTTNSAVNIRFVRIVGFAMVPAAIIYYTVIRRRLRVIARSRPPQNVSRRDSAMAEAEAARKRREHEKEMLARAKRRKAREQGLHVVKNPSRGGEER